MKRRSNRQKFKRRNNGLGKVKRDIKWLKMNVEFKFMDTEDAAYPVNTTPVVHNLNPVLQGTTVQSANVRDGDEITARRILIQGQIFQRGTKPDTVCRITLFRDKHPHGTLPTFLELFSSTAGTSNQNSLRNMENGDRFKVMADYRFAMDEEVHSQVPFKIIFKLNHVVRYKGTAVIPETNGLYLIATSQVAGTTNNPQLSFQARYSFCDS